MMEKDRKSKLWGVAATVVFHVLLVLLLLTVCLTYPPVSEPEREWPPVDSAEMLFGGEYVMIGDSPLDLDAADDSPAPAADDSPAQPSPETPAPENSGNPADPAPVLTSDRQSPAKSDKAPLPEKTGPTKAEKDAAEKARREAEQRQAINDRLKRTDFSGTGGAGSGKAGQPDGNSNTGATSGTPGYSLNGRTLSHYEQPPRGPLGTVTVSVTVNRKGQVTSARYKSGTGSAAANAATRDHCVRAAMRSQFSVDDNAPATQHGTITYNFR